MSTVPLPSLVPRLIHQTWRDSKPPTEVYLPEWINSWKQLMPQHQYRLWTDDDLYELGKLFDMRLEALPPVSKADVGRYLIMYTQGGIYVDLDYECLRNIESLLSSDYKAFSSWDCDEGNASNPRCINQAFLAAEPEQDLFRTLAQEGYKRWLSGVRPIEKATAQIMVTECWDYDKGMLLSAQQMCPLDWRKGQNRIGTSKMNPRVLRDQLLQKGAYAVTYWCHNWGSQ